MPTEYEMDRMVRLEPQSRFKSLYDWSIQELDEEGQQVGPDFIPFNYSLNFFATELRLSDSVSIERKTNVGEEAERLVVDTRRYIRGELQPGYPQQDQWSVPMLSFFGKKTPIESISLLVMPIGDAEEEGSALWGGLAWSSRDGEQFGDMLEVRLAVALTTFEHLENRIRERSVDIVNLRLSRVAGLFSEWSPDIDVRNLKILTEPKDHRLDTSEAGAINLRTIGAVKEAVLTLNTLQTFRAIPPDDDEGREVPTPNYGLAVTAAQQMGRPQIEGADIAGRIKQVTWLLAGILAVLVAGLLR